MNFHRVESKFAGVTSQSQTAAVSAPIGFVLCPVVMAAPGAWAPEIYRLAFERAREAVERPWFERFLAPAAN